MYSSFLDTNKDYAITVILNKEESELEFVELRSPDEEVKVPFNYYICHNYL